MKIDTAAPKRPVFKGMGPVSSALYTLSNNDMLNASFVDIFAMDTPRTIVETKYRGREAGIEMGFREYTGTFIAEFSAALFALMTSKIFARAYKPEIKVNSGSWATDKSLDVFNNIYKKSNKTPKGFVDKAFGSMEGLVGYDIKKFKEVEKPEMKEAKNALAKLISDNSLSKKESKKLLNTASDNIIKAFGADNNITVKSGGKAFSANLFHALRDMVDLGKNVFFTDDVKSGKINPDLVIKKLKTLNKSRIAVAIPLSMLLAITNQYINRKLTKKRTGIDNFVGEAGYDKNVAEKNEAKKEKNLILKKLFSAGVFIFMLSKVMGIKKPADLIKKLEFDGPATGGNAIKTVYGTLILGRIFASKDSTELRETNTRDYLGFLNWLVLGGFVSKGVANILDPHKQELFNVSGAGKGLGHWLKDVSLKSQKEIIANGKNVQKNLFKLNLAQISGIAYSAIMLGIFLPKFNIWMTRGRKKPENNESRAVRMLKPSNNLSFQATGFNEFLKSARDNNFRG